MKRISTLSLSMGTVLAVWTMTSGCSSGESDPSSNPSGGSGGAGGSVAGSSGSGGSSATGGSGSGTGGASGSGTGGSSGAGSGGTSSTPSVCDNNVHELTAAEAFVDDFETTTRFAGWYSFADTTTFTEIAAASGGAVSTTMAGHVSGTGVKAPTAGGFGAGFGFGMKDAAKACAGISAFDGVSFWAKGTAGTDNTLKFQAVLAATQAVADGGDCTANCYNHPSKTITLTPDWTHYTVLWSELAGTHTVDGVILGLNWITAGPDFDVWIDEVTLFAGTAPTGPVGTGADGGT